MDLLIAGGNFAKGTLFVAIGFVSVIYLWYRSKEGVSQNGINAILLGVGLVFIATGLHRLMWYTHSVWGSDANLVTSTIIPYLPTPFQLLGLLLIVSGVLKEFLGKYWIIISIIGVASLHAIGAMIATPW